MRRNGEIRGARVPLLRFEFDKKVGGSQAIKGNPGD
jgi:hypothetical protein